MHDTLYTTLSPLFVCLIGLFSFFKGVEWLHGLTTRAFNRLDRSECARYERLQRTGHTTLPPFVRGYLISIFTICALLLMLLFCEALANKSPFAPVSYPLAYDVVISSLCLWMLWLMAKAKRFNETRG